MFNSFLTTWTVAHQAPLSMGFPRQENWSGLPFPPLGTSRGPDSTAMGIFVINSEALQISETGVQKEKKM